MQRTDLDVRQPFTRASAHATGITDGMLRGPRFKTVFRGVHVDSAVPLTPHVRLLAALLLHPETAYASHRSAAMLLALPVPDSPLTHVSVLRKADRRPRAGIRCHLAPPEPSLTTVEGVRSSTPVQLFLELAPDLDLVELVTLGDAIVRRTRVTPEQLVRAADGVPGRRGDHVRRAAGYVRRRVDSPMESRLRMLIVLAGLPEPTVNLEILRPNGSVRYSFDLSYPDHKLVVEYDGGQHFEDAGQWSKDVDRFEWIDRAGWTLVRVIAQGIYRRPDRTLFRVQRALVEAGCPDVPRRLSDEWRAYFPVKP